jgi:hypothetical protein
VPERFVTAVTGVGGNKQLDIFSSLGAKSLTNRLTFDLFFF